MSNMIDVSIVITSYNYSKYLNRSIRSAFVQNYLTEQFEIIVVDDASTDWSREIIESYGKLIKAVFLEKNVGLSASRNVGIRIAQGKYIIFLDADDYLNRNTIFIESEFLKFNLDWDAVACDYYLLDENDETIDRKSCADMPIACGIMFRKEKLIEVGMYDESFKMWEEKDLLIRFKQKFNLHRVELPLYRYRRHKKNLTNDKVRGDEYMSKLVEKHKLK